MSTSFTAFKSRGFWCSDTLLEVVASLAAEHLRDLESADWAARYAAYLEIQARAGMPGVIDLNLDGIEDIARVELSAALLRVRACVREDASLLTASSLNARGLGGGGMFTRNLSQEDVLAVVDVLLALLNDEWKWTASDPESLPGNWLHDNGPDNGRSP